MIKKTAIVLAVIGIIWYSLHALGPSSKAYESQLRQFRHEKNLAFIRSSDSPISAAQKAVFDSLKYYSADANFIIECRLSRNARPDTIMLQMSDNKAEKYLRWGEALFSPPLGLGHEIHTLPDRLTLFLKANGTDSTLFVPFTDLTNGHETYGGGRYLDVPLPPADSTGIVLDFNRAYNPYCAYNNEYSCPVPPAENRMRVAIPAGEKSFHD